MLYSLHPYLQRHGVTVLGDVESLECGLSISFEAAERVGELQPQAFVEPAGDLDVDPPSLFGRLLARIENLQVSAPGDDVCLLEPPGKLRNAGRFVLTVAVECHQGVVAPFDRLPEGSTQSCSVAQVTRVPEDFDSGKAAEQFGGSVGRAVIDNKNGLGIPRDLVEHFFEVLLFIMNRNCCEQSHRRDHCKRVRTELV